MPAEEELGKEIGGGGFGQLGQLIFGRLIS